MLRRLLAVFCIATLVTSFVACGGPGEVKKTAAEDRNVPGQTDDGTAPNIDDPNSGAAASFE